jgi:uncharacterized surface protein with fasciclin (FAS1) repeats
VRRISSFHDLLDRPITTVAPTDETFTTAIRGLPAGVSDFLFANPDIWAEILTYHVVPGRILSTDLLLTAETNTNTTAITNTVNGADLEIAILSLDGTQIITVNDATVVTADLLP